jgi:hypothetical protein
MNDSLNTGKRALGFLFLAVMLVVFGFSAFAQQRGEARPKEIKRPWYELFEQNMSKYGIETQDVPYVPLMDYSESCSFCHDTFFKQWQYSAHGMAYTDPFYQQSSAEYREFFDYTNKNITKARQMGELKSDDVLPTDAQLPEKIDCLSCHAPAINVEIKNSTNRPMVNFLSAIRDGYIPDIEDVKSGKIDRVLGVSKKPWPNSDIAIRKQLNYWQRLNDYTKDGVSCDFCHTISRMGLPTERDQVKYPELYNQYYGLSYEHRFGIQKFGPLGEAPTSAHTIRYSSVYVDSRMCAPCHQEVNGYGVIVQDTYNEWLKSKYSRAGRDYKNCQTCHMPSAQDLGLGRLPPSIHGPDRREYHFHDFRGTSEAFLRGAAELTLNTERDGDAVKATVEITNTGAGHTLPTGIPFHQLVLVVRAQDADGNVLFENVKNYERKLGRSFDFREEVPYWEADSIVYDNRIPAGQKVTEEYAIDVTGLTGSAFVSAQLFYRKASKRFTSVYQLSDRPVEMYSIAEEVF